MSSEVGGQRPSAAVEALRNDEIRPRLGLVLGPNVTSPVFLHSGNLIVGLKNRGGRVAGEEVSVILRDVYSSFSG